MELSNSDKSYMTYTGFVTSLRLHQEWRSRLSGMEIIRLEAMLS